MREVRYLPHYTYEDYKNWQGDWELIEGIPVALASPKYLHQRTLTRLAAVLEETLEECDKCNVVVELDYIVSHDTVLRPDASVVCDEVDDYILKAPEIVFEIVSESTVERDEGVKKDIYEREGVRYYCILYPDRRMAKVYRNTERGFLKLRDVSAEKLTLELDECMLEIDFSKVWI